jgi:hypothetical protein
MRMLLMPADDNDDNDQSGERPIADSRCELAVRKAVLVMARTPP